MNWRDQGDGPHWLPALNAAEIKYGIPTDLLARIAFQECSFRRAVINGQVKSPAGATGLMQLMPQYYPNAGKNTLADIDTAAQLLANLYKRFHDWQTAVAAYNDGGGNVDMVLQGLRVLPLETRNYVADVFADVSVPSAHSSVLNA